MTEIEIERRQSSGAWKWILLLLVIAAIAAGVWWYLAGEDTLVDGAPAAEQVQPQPEPTFDEPSPLDTPAAEGGQSTEPAGGETLEPMGEPGPGPAPGEEGGGPDPAGRAA